MALRIHFDVPLPSGQTSSNILTSTGGEQNIIRIPTHIASFSVRRRLFLLQIGPRLFREIRRQRHQIRAIERIGNRRHLVVLARAGLEVAQLKKQIAEILAPDHRNRKRLLRRHPGFAVAGGTDLGFFLDRLGVGGDGGEQHQRERQSRWNRKSFHGHPRMEPCEKRAGRRRASDNTRLDEKGRGRCRSRPKRITPRRRLHYSAVNAMTLLPRLELTCTLPPAATTMYCLPATW